jgi:DNA-binding transcriptional LysR family regulator
MDRIEAMKIFIAALDEGSLAGASRRTGRSPAAVSRAVASLEAHVGVPLLHRTTRSIKLSEAGERYATACRKVLADLEEADRQAAERPSWPTKPADAVWWSCVSTLRDRRSSCRPPFRS